MDASRPKPQPPPPGFKGIYQIGPPRSKHVQATSVKYVTRNTLGGKPDSVVVPNSHHVPSKIHTSQSVSKRESSSVAQPANNKPVNALADGNNDEKSDCMVKPKSLEPHISLQCHSMINNPIALINDIMSKTNDTTMDVHTSKDKRYHPKDTRIDSIVPIISLARNTVNKPRKFIKSSPNSNQKVKKKVENHCFQTPKTNRVLSHPNKPFKVPHSESKLELKLKRKSKSKSCHNYKQKVDQGVTTVHNVLSCRPKPNNDKVISTANNIEKREIKDENAVMIDEFIGNSGRLLKTNWIKIKILIMQIKMCALNIITAVTVVMTLFL